MADSRRPDRAAVNQAFGARILAARQQQGCTLRQLTEKSGVPYATISRAERGAEMYLSAAVLVARALHLDLCTAASPLGCAVCKDMPPPGYTCNECGHG